MDIIVPSTPKPAPFVATVTVYVNHLGQRIESHTTIDTETIVISFHSIGVMELDMGNGNIVPHQFAYVIPGMTVHEAFANIEEAYNAGAKAEYNRLLAKRVSLGITR